MTGLQSNDKGDPKIEALFVKKVCFALNLENRVSCFNLFLIDKITLNSYLEIE